MEMRTVCTNFLRGSWPCYDPNTKSFGTAYCLVQEIRKHCGVSRPVSRFPRWVDTATIPNTFEKYLGLTVPEPQNVWLALKSPPKINMGCSTARTNRDSLLWRQVCCCYTNFVWLRQQMNTGTLKPVGSLASFGWLWASPPFDFNLYSKALV